jgi:ABC-type anion transport system duplicated permease subunit
LLVDICPAVSPEFSASIKVPGFLATPFPIVVKAIFGGLVYGYVGSTRKHDLEAVFVYSTLLGLVLSWLLHKSKRKPTFIIGLIAVLHIVLSVLTFFPMVLLGGR